MNELIDAFSVYLEVNKNYSPGTVQVYNQTLIKFSSWLQEVRKICDIKNITVNDIQLFLGTLRHPAKKKGGKEPHPKARKVFEPSTRARIISAIKQFFKWAVKHHFVQIDVAQHIENPKLPERLPKSLTLQDAMKLEAVSKQRVFKERDHFITVLFLLLGMRVSELVNIDLQHINLDEGTIRIIGKGNKERRLAMTPKIFKCLGLYLVKRTEILQKRNNMAEKALFISIKRGTRLTRRAVALIIEEIAESNGVKANNMKVTPHKLRHTCATVFV
ncbi:tyrosine-type recombinase/integrase [Cohnella sp. CFH 77786]|uniref:tyrosine-type recombinase/integrase n=1 Tax=Cohnella sp. CFH 77786 TaxID=2662265 RepID=UPI001C60DCA4|nr:tyrosine-type recombinase/integrase [Cohnella sp. CFH 77786]MBW5446515.1 tyrosine-type recombinase/integrase [Cohnella sp. CFH 77786]